MKKRILCMLLALLMAVSLIPGPAFATGEETSYDFSSDVGNYAEFSAFSVEYGVLVSGDPETDGGLMFYYDEFGEDTMVRITDWYWDAETTALWYAVELYSGAFPESTEDVVWPDTPWMMQNYTENRVAEEDALTFVPTCEICGKPACTVEHVYCEHCGIYDCGKTHTVCDICGQYDCGLVHLYCELCEAYDCGLEHLFCLACEIYDCPLTHTFCGYCNEYDCGIDHLAANRPVEAPVIPENPTLTEGADVSIVGEDGAAVTADGLILAAGKRFSLSAWSDLESAGADYQWQIRYDEMNDLWVDIQGQTEKGILVSPAMFLSVIEEHGSVAIRCVMTSGGETQTSDAIPVYVVEPVSLTAFASFGARTFASGVMPMAEGDDPGTELKKAYVVVQYVYQDGRTAAAADFAEIIAGAEHRHNYDLPKIPGYKATLNTHSHGDKAKIVDDKLVMNFAAGELTDEYTIFTVTYVPDYVRYTVIHYWQNVDDDNYTEHEREVIPTQHKTGEKIDDAHKDYAGFYHLLYDTPTAAADGSTVIEVYYDRYYNLLRFELGENGYGADPIYARVGSHIEVGTPTRAGYTFVGWQLNGVDTELPDTMPSESRTYTAVWQAADTAKVSVVIWGENPDDEKYSYQKTIQIDAKPGDEISWDSYCFTCGKKAHTHNATCGYNCGKEEHSHSIENGCYTLTCTQVSHNHDDCTLNCTHTCTVDCYQPNASSGNYTYSLRVSDRPGEITGYDRDGVYSYTDGNWMNRTTHYYLKIGDSWYCVYRKRNNQNTWNLYDTVGIKHACSHIHTDGQGGCYSCGLIANDHEHSITNNCYQKTCTKEEHLHSASCGYACGVTEEHVHKSTCGTDKSDLNSNLWTLVKSESKTVNADGSTVINVYYDRKTFTLTFHYNYSNYSYRSTSTIIDKWGADIGERFIAVSDTANGNLWSTDTDGSSPWTGYLQIMPENDEDYYCRYSSSNGQTAEYYTENVDGTYSLAYSVTAYYDSNLTISAEDFYEMEGFTYDHGTDGDGDDMPSPGSYGDFGGAKLYYKRHRYAIEFYNPTSLIRKTEGVAYGVDLDSYDWTPKSTDVPTIYEPGSKKFAGWYLNPECSGEQYILANHTMPSASEDGATALVLYAKWVGVDCTVSYYLDKKSLERDETIPEEMVRLVEEAFEAGTITTRPEDTYSEAFKSITVEFGSFIEEHEKPGVSPGYEEIFPYKGYTFVAWFYVDEDGEEKAFDPANMPVKDDLKLYAKWDAGNILCTYNVYFALDAKNNTTGAEGADGVADVDTDGNIIYVAAPITGSGIGGHTYTFTAKGGEDLYDGFREGYFPTVGSHSIDIDISDLDGTTVNTYTFLYRKRDAVPYTVKYWDKETNQSVIVDGNPVADKVVSDNRNVVVTENFVYIQGYMPDAYQKTLVVTADGTNEIIFYYTKDTEHALYVVNYYIEQLDADLKHAGWLKYTDLQYTGDIGVTYTADAIDIDGFTLSASYTDEYNVNQKKNGMDGTDLPADVSELTADNKLSGTLAKEGMQLNFYYTRNLYPYVFRYMLSGTAISLADPVSGKAGFDTLVTEAAKGIKKDLDGDGILEDYKLYDATETSKSIRIKVDSGDANGNATINVATFYYVRCTQTMTIKKEFVGTNPDPDREFQIRLLIHAKNGYHRNSYAYTKSDGTKGELVKEASAPNTLLFTLKEGQTITIEGLPTAEYTITELNLPEGYTDISGTKVRHKLTVDGQLDIVVINTYLPQITYHSNYPVSPQELPVIDRMDYGEDYVVSANVFDVPTGYRFIGWNTAKGGDGTAYTGGKTYNGSTDLTLYAQWELLTYTVTFVDEDGTTVLKAPVKYDYGTPAANIVVPPDPAKEATDQYTYTFAGWTPVLTDVTGDAVYKATYTETVRKYTVTFVDEDGTTVLKEATEYEYGTPAEDVVKPANPTKESTEQYTYTFADWTPVISDVTGDVTYKATYTEALRKYTVTWKNEDGTVLKTDEVEYGTVPSYDGETPTKDPDPNGSTYSFEGWDPEIVAVTGDAVYTAVYTLDTADFTITINRAKAKEGEVFVYRVEGNDLSIDVTIQVDGTGTGSVTIADLPTGTYTVTQLNDWSWRYGENDEVKTVTHRKDSESEGVTFDASSVIDKWLSGISDLLHNIFGGAG